MAITTLAIWFRILPLPFDTIYKGDGLRLILSKQRKVTNAAIFIELTPADDGDFYDVKTGLIARKNYFSSKLCSCVGYIGIG